MTILGIELEVVVQTLRDPHFQERAIVGLIVLAALASLARGGPARLVARLAAWDKARARYRQGRPKATRA